MAKRVSPDPEPHPDPHDPQAIRSLSPEARRRDAGARRGRLGLSGSIAGDQAEPRSHRGLRYALGPGTRPFEVLRRTVVGSYNDGFIHAGNLAYLSLLAIFPFFILSGFVFQLFGEVDDRRMMIETVLVAMPLTVRQVIAPVAENVIHARSGWLLWFGAGVALWTVSSLVETIRDILRRAYGTRARRAFWKNRLLSAGLIIGAVVLLLVSLFAQVAIGTAVAVIDTRFPQLAEAISALRLSRVVPALGLFGSLYLLFFTLTPPEYRPKHYPKWPGALFTSLWWIAVSVVFPPILARFFTYDLTYGSMAGIVVALFFFWLVGLGLVIGAELNAALAEPETDRGETSNRLGDDPAEKNTKENPRWAD